MLRILLFPNASFHKLLSEIMLMSKIFDFVIIGSNFLYIKNTLTLPSPEEILQTQCFFLPHYHSRQIYTTKPLIRMSFKTQPSRENLINRVKNFGL